MNLLGLGLARMDRARSFAEAITDPARVLEHFGLRRGEPGERVIPALARDARSHRRLADIGRAAEWAFDQAASTLLIIIQARAEPGLKPFPAIAALEVEDDHDVT